MSTIFSKIISKEIPADIVYDNNNKLFCKFCCKTVMISGTPYSLALNS